MPQNSTHAVGNLHLQFIAGRRPSAVMAAGVLPICQDFLLHAQMLPQRQRGLMSLTSVRSVNKLQQI